MLTWLVVAVVVGGAAVGALLWWLVAWGPELGRVSVEPGVPFRLQLVAAGDVTLWCDVAVAWAQDLELQGTIVARVAGAASGTPHAFWLSPRGSTVKGVARGGVKKRWLMHHGRARGVTRVARIACPAQGAELVLEGTLTPGAGTTVEKLQLVVAAPRGARP